MDPSESIVQFSSKISVIANEAEVLGKTYKDQKLVKKLLRCLPQKFGAHKAVIRVSGNTESMSYEELVDMLKSEKMEVDEDRIKTSKGIAFIAEKENSQLQELKESMSLMARNFGKALRRVEKGQTENHLGSDEKCNYKNPRSSGDKDVRKRETML